MKLEPDEERMLGGEDGEAAAKAMEILLAIGNIYDARRFLNVESVQVAGVSYQNLGDAGLEFIQDWARSAHTKTFATLNPAGMDLELWEEQGMTQEFACKQKEVIDAYQRMGIVSTCTCTPYLIGQLPMPGEHIAWSESSAVCFANSVLGARTNREGGPSALASAITGKTPEYGFHLDAERKPGVLVHVECNLKGTNEFSALGYAIGKAIGPSIPYIKGVLNPSLENLKSFCAAIATSGGTALFYMEGLQIIPALIPKESIVIKADALAKAYDEFNDDVSEFDLVALGCPHLSLKEIRIAASLLQGKHVSKELWLCTSRFIKNMADRAGYVSVIEKAGARLICDTCPAVSPLKSRFNTMLTDSAKGCYYARGTNKFKVKLYSFQDCINKAI